MTSFIAILRNASGKLSITVDIEAPTSDLALQGAYLFAKHERGQLRVIDVHERRHLLKVDASGDVQISRFHDDWESYPDEAAH